LLSPSGKFWFSNLNFKELLVFEIEEHKIKIKFQVQNSNFSKTKGLKGLEFNELVVTKGNTLKISSKQSSLIKKKKSHSNLLFYFFKPQFISSALKFKYIDFFSNRILSVD